jgi:hypothetical protein
MKPQVLGWFLAAALCATAGTVQAVESELLRCAAVAESDFSVQLREQLRHDEAMREALAREGKPVSDGSLSHYLADIRNYEIRVWREGDMVVVQFWPRPPKGVSIRGGGGEYRIDRKHLRVLSAQLWQ